MMQRLSLSVRRTLALAILGALAGTCWLYLLLPAVQLITDRVADIDLLAEQLTHFRDIEARRPMLEATVRGLRARVAAEASLWPGPNATAIAAAMQDLVRQATTSGGGQMKSTSSIGEAAEGGLRSVTVQFQIEGPIAALQATLNAIERARPRLFVEQCSISAPAWQNGIDRQPVLQMQIRVMGFAGTSPA